MGSGCGCGTASNNAPYTGFTPAIQVTAALNCMVERDMLLNWKSKLDCVQAKHLYSVIGIEVATLNRLSGIVQSALNWTSNYCYFEHQLREVLLLMPKIIATGQCDTNSVNN